MWVASDWLGSEHAQSWARTSHCPLKPRACFSSKLTSAFSPFLLLVEQQRSTRSDSVISDGTSSGIMVLSLAIDVRPGQFILLASAFLPVVLLVWEFESSSVLKDAGTTGASDQEQPGRGGPWSDVPSSSTETHLTALVLLIRPMCTSYKSACLRYAGEWRRL